MRALTLLAAVVCPALACGGSDLAGGGGDAGAGAPPAGGGGAGASVEIVRLDASGECDGLVPAAAPVPVTVSRAAPEGAACIGGTSDGTGHVAVGAVVAGAGGVASWQAFAADGTALGRFQGEGLDALVPGPEGFHGGTVARDGGGQVVRLDHVHVGPDGGERLRAQASGDPAAAIVTGWRISGDPAAGGSMIATGETAVRGNHWSSVFASRFAPTGAPESVRERVDGVSDPRVDFLAAGVSRLGPGVVTWRTPGTLNWKWIAPDGAALAQGSADQESLQLGLPELVLAPLLDGGLAVRVDGRWRFVLAHLATAVTPAPGWLAGLAPGTTIRLTRGNRGYAVLPPPGQGADGGGAGGGCAQRVELLAPSGRRCGAITFREVGGSCTAGRIEQGWDGTVVRQIASTGATCAVRFWPGVLGP